MNAPSVSAQAADVPAAVREELAALLPLLAASVGPDREVDARLWRAFNPDLPVLLDPGVFFGRGKKSAAVIGPLREFDLSGWSDWNAVAGHIGAPALTASLDVALAFVDRVLPGANFLLARGRSRPAEPLYGIHLLFGSDQSLGEGEHDSAPHAIIMALVRALIAPSAAGGGANGH